MRPLMLTDTPEYYDVPQIITAVDATGARYLNAWKLWATSIKHIHIKADGSDKKQHFRPPFFNFIDT